MLADLCPWPALNRRLRDYCLPVQRVERISHLDKHTSRVAFSNEMFSDYVWTVVGSGRVTFSSHKSYVKAVSAAFVEIKTAKFTKKVSCHLTDKGNN